MKLTGLIVKIGERQSLVLKGLNLWNNLKGVNWQPLKTMYGRMM